MNENVKLFVEKRQWTHGDLLVHILDVPKQGYDKRRVASLVWEEVEGFTENPSGTGIPLTETQAQMLMDRLWDCGIRPSEGSGSAGSLLATQGHLMHTMEYMDRLMKIVEGEFVPTQVIKEVHSSP